MRKRLFSKVCPPQFYWYNFEGPFLLKVRYIRPKTSKVNEQVSKQVSKLFIIGSWGMNGSCSIRDSYVFNSFKSRRQSLQWSDFSPLKWVVTCFTFLDVSSSSRFYSLSRSVPLRTQVLIPSVSDVSVLRYDKTGLRSSPLGSPQNTPILQYLPSRFNCLYSDLSSEPGTYSKNSETSRRL